MGNESAGQEGAMGTGRCGGGGSGGPGMWTNAEGSLLHPVSSQGAGVLMPEVAWGSLSPPSLRHAFQQAPSSRQATCSGRDGPVPAAAGPLSG